MRLGALRRRARRARASSASSAASTGSPSLERAAARPRASRGRRRSARVGGVARAARRPRDSSPLRSSWPASTLRAQLVAPGRRRGRSRPRSSTASGPASSTGTRPPSARRCGGRRPACSRRSRQLRSPGAAVADDGAQDLVAVAEDVGRDRDGVADGALDRLAAAVDGRRRVLDPDARRRRLAFGRGHARHGSHPTCSPNVTTSLDIQRRAAAPDLAAGRPARARRPTRSSTGSRRPGQSWWQMLPLGPPDRHGSPYKAALGVRGLAGLLAEPARAGVARPRRDAFRERDALLDRGLGGVRRRRARGRRPGALRPRVGGAARVRRRARRAADRRRARSTSRPAAPTTRAHPELFRDDVVAGAPPDAFTDKGQLWGNPLYDWPALRRRRLPLVDRAPARARSSSSTSRASTTSAASSPTGRCPRGARDALGGRWKRGPGPRACSTPRARELGELPLIAEDLGVITPAVDAAARRRSACRAWSSCSSASTRDEPDSAAPPRAPPRRTRSLYTGTHDNDTLRGWYESLPPRARRACVRAAGVRARASRGGALIELALSLAGAAVHGPGPGRARARSRGADEHAGRGGRAVEVAAGRGAADAGAGAAAAAAHRRRRPSAVERSRRCAANCSPRGPAAAAPRHSLAPSLRRRDEQQTLHVDCRARRRSLCRQRARSFAR